MSGLPPLEAELAIFGSSGKDFFVGCSRQTGAVVRGEHDEFSDRQLREELCVFFSSFSTGRGGSGRWGIDCRFPSSSVGHETLYVGGGEAVLYDGGAESK